MAYDADECTQALPVVDALKRASLRESLACEATAIVGETTVLSSGTRGRAILMKKAAGRTTPMTAEEMQAVEEAVHTLHSGGFMHGNENVLVIPQKEYRVSLLAFQCSGKEGLQHTAR